MPPRPLRPSWPGAALLCAVTVSAAACEPMESRGDPFAPARAPVAAAAPTEADPAFAFPSDPPLLLTSEELAKGDLGTAMTAAAGVDANTVVGADAAPAAAPAVAPAPAAAPAPPAVGLAPAVQWPVRLVSTLPQAQPPRAILGLPSGEERVVSPGSMLAELGLVVMTVTADRVQLAKVQPAGDHATIETIELTAQYGAR
ncbi:MAG: hypothetical protein ACK4YP_01670 [Myxococcota bacterium]